MEDNGGGGTCGTAEGPCGRGAERGLRPHRPGPRPAGAAPAVWEQVSPGSPVPRRAQDPAWLFSVVAASVR